jgi:hypothetical protein
MCHCPLGGKSVKIIGRNLTTSSEFGPKTSQPNLFNITDLINGTDGALTGR